MQRGGRPHPAAGTPPADLDRELRAQGAANAVSGLLGGLPVASVIVRSTANVDVSGRTRLSPVLHGAWVLVLALACAPLIERVPLSALAALLVVLGLRLTDPARVRDLRHHREAPAYFGTVVASSCWGSARASWWASRSWRCWRCAGSPGCRSARSGSRPCRTTGPPRRVSTWSSRDVHLPRRPRVTRALQEIPAGCGVDLDLNVDFMDHAAFDAIHQWRLAHERQGGGSTSTRFMRLGMKEP